MVDLERLRHSAAHVMAQAVLELFPGAKLADGPAIEDGFYYDFDLPRPLTPQDLEKIERRMRELIIGNHPFLCREVSPDEVRELFKDQPYKLERINIILKKGTDEYGNLLPTGQRPILTTYRHDTFEDLCCGPHVEHTGQINPDGIKLLRVAGAYWLGDERQPMLQRIYGTVWPSKAKLEAYLQKLAEAEKRDHRRLGKELELFSIHNELGGGLVLWHPKGALIRAIIEDFSRQAHLEGGYDLVYSPHIGRAELWKTSGHLSFYKESMYAPIEIEGQEYYLKPMNCPFHIMIYKSRQRSYRELPMRLAEFGTVYRYEQSGVLHGLIRVRGFTQDDAHIFCRPDQVEGEIQQVLDFCLNILQAFNFHNYHIELSVRDPDKPEKYAGHDADWQMAEVALSHALDAQGFSYQRKEGEAVFYGPKIDIKIKDALGRFWQCSTIQFDFNLPERFELSFVGNDGQEHRPYMIHRALFGSFERFFGLLIEYYAGAFPVWLAPIQVVILPVTDRNIRYAEYVEKKLRKSKVRAKAWVGRSATLSHKVREAQLQKVPYMLIVGDREEEDGKVSLRLRTGEDLGPRSLKEFKHFVRGKIKEKKVL